MSPVARLVAVAAVCLPASLAGVAAARHNAASRPPGAIDLRRPTFARIDGAVGAQDPEDFGDQAAWAVAGGKDVDGDGVPDVVVGAPAADGVRAGSGSAFVVFGHGLAGAVDLSALGPGGFRIDGATQNGFAAESVALADDVNGDGLAEVAVGGFDAYVVFGRAGSEPVDLAKLGSAGYRIEAGVGTGSPRVIAAAGDVNGDGVGDLVLGAPQARSRGRDGSGAAYVVFGKTDSSAIELENLGPAGFRIDGPAPARAAGWSVGGAGDMDGDGLADVVVGAPGNGAGNAYVVFGKHATGEVDLATLGTAGFRIKGPRPRAGDNTGLSVSAAGDVNGDGRGDIVVAAPSSLGAYVVFGKSGSGEVVLGHLGRGGFRLDGDSIDEVARAGDVDADGRDDVLVANAVGGSPGRSYSGRAYLVFGKRDSRTIDLRALRAHGVPIDGARELDTAGDALAAAGDVDGDGRHDVLIGAPGADNNSRGSSGSAYLLTGPFTPDTRTPSLRVRARSPQHALTRGLRVTARCDEPCALRATAVVGRLVLHTVRRLGDGPRALALGLTGPVRELVSRQGAAQALVTVRASDRAGNTRVVRLRVSLRR